MAILFNDNLNVAINKPTDSRYGPYATTSAAIAAIPGYKRYVGLTVGIITSGIVADFWFRDGVRDIDLIVKSVGGDGGNIGAAGFDGATGFTGATGYTGYTGATGPAATVVGGGVRSYFNAVVGASGAGSIDAPNGTRTEFRGINGYDPSATFRNEATSYLVNLSGQLQIPYEAYTIADCFGGDCHDGASDLNIGKIVFSEAVPTDWSVSCLAIQVGNAPVAPGANLLTPAVLEKVDVFSSFDLDTDNNINADLISSQMKLFTLTASSNFNINIRGSSSRSLNSLLRVGQASSTVLMIPMGSSVKSLTSVKIDNTPTTVKWTNSTFEADKLNIVSFTVIKTGDAAYTTVGSVNTAV